MRWWEKLLGIKRTRLGPPSVTPGLRQARNESAEARRKLAETQRMNNEVQEVSETSRRLRQENHFAAGIAEAFRRPHG